MPYLGICCAKLKDNKALMKMGLGLVLVGHVNFLLGALVHGAVLRHISVHHQARTMVYAISNVIAIVAGLFGIIDGILTIVLSKNKRNRILKWTLLFFTFIVGLLAIASAIGLSISMVQAIINKGKSLLTHCNSLDQFAYECPFDPTRLYTTTLILWVPLIIISVVEAIFAFRGFAVCTSSLYLCPCRRRPLQARRVRIQQKEESPSTPSPNAEPAEDHELLDGATAVAQSDWL